MNPTPYYFFLFFFWYHYYYPAEERGYIKYIARPKKGEDTSREARPNKGVRGQYDYESNNHFFLLKSIFLLMLLPNERK